MTAEVETLDHKLAAFLSDRKRSSFLDPYLAQDSSVAQAAILLGVSDQRMHYWTRQLLQLGLIRQVGVVASGRHRSRIYRSVADAFRVPLDRLPTDDVETLALYFDPIWRRFLQSVAVAARKYAPGWHVLYSRVGGQPAFHIAPSSAAEPAIMPSFTNSWARLQLTRDQAQALRTEMDRLLQHYLAQPADEHSRPFIAHVALVEDEGSD